MNRKRVIRIAILASGNGSNAQKMIEYFSGHAQIEVSLIVSNIKDAYVLERAQNALIPYSHLPAQLWKKNPEYILKTFEEFKIDFIVLGGYLLLIPDWFISKFANKIVNIHPALLPKYGGKGMYGKRVHEAVILSGEKESGISIHYVNEEYDQGDIIFQAKCKVDVNETSDSLADKIHQLEHIHFPKVVENLVYKTFGISDSK